MEHVQEYVSVSQGARACCAGFLDDGQIQPGGGNVPQALGELVADSMLQDYLHDAARGT
jgi:hypothetical protein